MTNLWFIIVNPAAGGGKVARLWPRIERDLQAEGFSYSVRFSERKMHAADLAEEAIARGYRKILGIGGDGTIHEIANGILRQDFAPSAEIKLALVPIGSGNDWAKEWNLPKSPLECLRKIKLENTRFQDAGLVRFQQNGVASERFFINVAGMAYDGFVCRAANEKSGAASGFFGYYALIIKCLWKYKLTPAQLFWEENGVEKSLENAFYTINIGLCRFSGGGMQLVPHAIPDDGFFALTFARKMSKWAVLLATPYFFNGKIARHSAVTCTQSRSIRVTHAGENPAVLLETDGEFLGESPTEFMLLEKVLCVVC
jgi:diacylglycerol kinase (ATP)